MTEPGVLFLILEVVIGERLLSFRSSILQQPVTSNQANRGDTRKNQHLPLGYLQYSGKLKGPVLVVSQGDSKGWSLRRASRSFMLMCNNVIIGNSARRRLHDSRRGQADSSGRVLVAKKRALLVEQRLVLSITVALLHLRGECRRRHRPIQPSAKGAETSGGRNRIKIRIQTSNGQFPFLP